MKVLSKILILVLVISFVSSSCSDGQIDINSASKTDLEKLIGIGEVKSQSIIDSRPFESVDDLIKVYGIGPATLEKIKDQGLACVNSSETFEEEEEESEEKSNDEESSKIFLNEKEPEEKIEEEKIVEVVKLVNPKDIKSEKNNSKLENKNFAGYGLVGFVILLGILFFIRKKTVYKNEFKS